MYFSVFEMVLTVAIIVAIFVKYNQTQLTPYEQIMVLIGLAIALGIHALGHAYVEMNILK
jgi:hypothetical protein